MKHHNNLTDDQIHKPKGFIPAANRSIVTKDAQGNLVWEKANYTSSIAITPVADYNGDLHNRYFCLYKADDTLKYAVYFKTDSSGAAFTTPSGYDAVIEVNCLSTGLNSTAAQVAGYLNTAINGHSDFTSSINEAGTIVTITGLQSATDPVDVSTQFTIVTTQTKVVNEVLTTDSSGDFKFVTKSSFSSEIEDVEGTEVKSTGESGGTKYLREDGDGTCSWQSVPTGTPEGTAILSTGIEGTTKYLRADGDGTCSWQTVSGGDGDITGVTLAGDSGSAEDLTANVNLTIAGGDGITTSAADSTLTISLTEEKKSKSDIDTLTGVTATNLGSFTGTTIADSRNVKGALQDLETKVEKQIISESIRFETNNLAANSGETYRHTFQGEHTTKGGMIASEVNLSALSFPTALRGCVYVRPTVVKTYTFARGSMVVSGTGNNDAWKMYAYKIPKIKSGEEIQQNFCGVNTAGDGFTMEVHEMAVMTCTNASSSGNNSGHCYNFTLSSEEGVTTLAAQDMIMLAIYYEGDDLDVRGQITFEIEVTG